MPLFEYDCTECGRRFEEIVSGGARVKCPSCGSENLTKLISGFAVGSSVRASGAGGCGQVPLGGT